MVYLKEWSGAGSTAMKGRMARTQEMYLYARTRNFAEISDKAKDPIIKEKVNGKALRKKLKSAGEIGEYDKAYQVTRAIKMF